MNITYFLQYSSHGIISVLLAISHAFWYDIRQNVNASQLYYRIVNRVLVCFVLKVVEVDTIGFFVFSFLLLVSESSF